MFANCCGRNKKTKKVATKDVETQSDNEVLAVIETVNESVNETVPSEEEKIVEEPKASSDIKRQSVVSDVKIEISDNDDDDVFCEGVGPPVRLADNLAAPKNKGQVYVPLPKWFSEEEEDEDDEEVGGVQEPPATPIGKDELALRRHRFFSELLSAAQNANEHKVHFDPLGPVVAGAGENSQQQDLENLVTRLEKVTTRLENVCLPVQELLKSGSVSSITEEKANFQSVESLTELTMSVQAFQEIIQSTLVNFIKISHEIGGDVANHSQMVQEAFHVQAQYLLLASHSKQPSQADIKNLIQPTAQCITKIQDFRERNRGSKYFNHLSAISESIPALGWIAVSPTPAPYIKEMNDAGQFYTNRVLKEWKEKDKKHVDWVKGWVQTLTELQAFVKQHHTTGLVWGGKNSIPPGAPAPPPPNCPPPPPSPLGEFATTIDANNDRSALFAQINQGENITKGLKKVTDEMQTHKNPTLREGPAPFKAPSTIGMSQVKAPVVDKPPSFVRDGKKWLIEYQKGNKNLLVEGAEMNNVVYLYKCVDSTLIVKGKINSITLDSCKKTSVVFDSLVSVIEFINCQSMQMQVLAKVPTISIDKTDGCQIYLSNESMEVEIVSSKSSEMNVLVPKPNGDYVEYPVPEQFKTTIVPGKGLNTIIIENKS